MKRNTVIIVLLILVCFVFRPSVLAQTTPDVAEGKIPYEPYSVSDIDSVDMGSGNLLLHIPLLSYPQRGSQLKFSFTLYYSNRGWQRVYYKNSTDGKEGQWQNAGIIGPLFAMDGLEYSYSTSQLVPGTGPGTNNQSRYVAIGWAYSADGSAHQILAGMAFDGTGIAGASAGIADRNGVVSVPVSDPNPNYMWATDLEDTDGNRITQTSSGWVDTVGRYFPGTVEYNPYSEGAGSSTPTPLQPEYILYPGVPVSNVSSTLCPAGTQSAFLWDVPAPASAPTNGTAQYTFCYEKIGYASEFGDPNFDEGAGYANVLVAVILPNNTSWSFTYNSWGEITSVTYPTGALISYQWTTPGTLTLGASLRAVSSRSLNANDGSPVRTWSYSWYQQQNSGNYIDIQTSPPDGNGVQNDTTSNWTGGYPCLGSEVEYYSGSYTSGTLLKTVDTIKASAANPLYYLPGQSNCMNAVPISVTTTLPNGQISKTVTSYDSGVPGEVCIYNVVTQACPYTSFTVLRGVPLLVKEYDYGASSPTRQTATTYEWQKNPAYGAANLLTLPQAVVTEDGNGNRAAETDYVYDELRYLTASGITMQASPPYGSVRGDPTTVTKWLNTGTPPSSHTNWYDTGEVYQKIDALGYTTIYNYLSAYGGSLPTLVTNALGQKTSYSYDFNSGRMMSMTDPNGKISSYYYQDSLSRLTKIVYPDGGQTTYQYDDFASPENVVVTKMATPSPSITEEYDVDGFGREIQTKLTSDPEGIVYTQTAYDGPGRVWTTTTPYRKTNDPTYGITKFFYDGLGRKTSDLHSDGGSESWKYTGSSVLYTDGNMNQRQQVSDAFGRLTTVMEPNGTSTSPTMETDYNYDLLSNLLTVSQWGGSRGSSGGRSRSFTYDSLSRLLTASNPETGTICYGAWSGTSCGNGYDADGNLKLKTDARGVATNYAYDQLNRLLSKTYSNDPSGTPFMCYQYDQSSIALPNANLIGRLTNQWTQSSGAGSCSFAWPSPTVLTARSILLYDAMGRIVNEQQCTPSNCSTGAYTPTYTYDIAGNTLSMTNGITSTPVVGALSLSSNYTGAGHLETLTSNWVDQTHPATLFSTPGSQPTSCPNSLSQAYAAFGGLMNSTYGNGLTLNRGFDARLRTTCEMNTGGVVQNSTPGTAMVVITGEEQSQ